MLLDVKRLIHCAVVGLAVLVFIVAIVNPIEAVANGDTVTRLETERTLIAIADALDNAVDSKDWPRARSYFADTVRVDFSSLGGGEPATIKSDDLIAAWRTNLFPEKTSFHLRGNHLVTIAEKRASMTSHGYAWNKLPGLEGGELWEVWGRYEYTFRLSSEGWKINSFTFVMTHQRGNPAVRTAVRNP